MRMGEWHILPPIVEETQGNDGVPQRAKCTTSTPMIINGIKMENVDRWIL